MPFILCLTLAYSIACVSPSVMIPGLMGLMDKGYGHEKGICAAMIGSGTIEDILCIFLCSIVRAMSYSSVGMGFDTSMGLVVGIVLLENLCGLIVGVLLGLLGSLLNRVDDESKLIKMWYCIFCSIFLVFLGEVTDLINMKYIASMTLGYVCSRVWGDNKPK